MQQGEASASLFVYAAQVTMTVPEPSSSPAPAVSPGPIFLVGMMGAGKSTVGRALAADLDATFVDLDRRIERMFGASVAELFEDGEAYFRACERAALCSLLDEPGFAGARVVIATGGGVVVDPANRADMAGAGRVVYLELPVDALVARLSTDAARAERPLLEDRASLRERLDQLLRARASAYASAELCVDARPPVPAVVEALRAALAA